ncbi:hypothetical protein MKW98_019830 [Papaver atlanticum]|uniref:Uncharacterized protein n=1 Tax=Papaver atlanticum TaxID=357466 RepID=A0AAD4TFE7_9MAGN|nr:hypothetical protein MKW98_019830 [Papaver atlanticum]
MQSGEALSCGNGETNTCAVMSRNTCEDCRKELQTNCGLQRKVVSHLECNHWDHKHIKETVCEGCCGVPQPCPLQPPAAMKKCAATDTDRSFSIENSPLDCNRCRDDCNTRCGVIPAKVGDQICVSIGSGKLHCTCCCREDSALIAQSPTPENICKSEEIYVAFQLSDPQGCGSCAGDCTSKCSGLGGSMKSQECTTKSSSSRCKCCCETPSPSLEAITSDSYSSTSEVR